jgi:hypothetical protein
LERFHILLDYHRSWEGGVMLFKFGGLSLLAVSLCLPVGWQTARAAEGASSTYLLGSRTAGAGIQPPPGLYFQNDIYFYSGGVDASIEVPLRGAVVAGIEAKAALELATLLWSTPTDILGGNLGLIAVIPLGYKSVDAFAGVLSVTDSDVAFGDPQFGANIGWHADKFHWQVGTMVNVPIGKYDVNDLANMGFNRWSLDVYGAGTWLDPDTGLELSAAMGVVFNGRNPATDYDTGNELHFEWAAIKHFTPQFSAGAVGYAYQQISPDGGSGAALGDFEGRVFAIGATAAYDFKLGQLPLSTRVKYFHEFATENRLAGDAVTLTVGFPISMH